LSGATTTAAAGMGDHSQSYFIHPSKPSMTLNNQGQGSYVTSLGSAATASNNIPGNIFQTL